MSGCITDLTLLRGEFRTPLAALTDMLARENIPLRVHESIRSPARQAKLYAIGRNPEEVGYGRTVTRAHPYESAHQFGLAVDLVFHVNGKWTWDEPEWGLWDRMAQLARVAGLEVLSFERPHVQMPGFDHDRKGRPRGPAYTDGWLTWLGETDVV